MITNRYKRQQYYLNLLVEIYFFTPSYDPWLVEVTKNCIKTKLKLLKAKLTDGDLCDFKYDTKACCSRTGISREPWFNIEMEQTYNIRQVNLKTYTEDGKFK